MKRIWTVLTATAVVAALMAVMAVPALADDDIDFDDLDDLDGFVFIDDDDDDDIDFDDLDDGSVSLEIGQEAESGDVELSNEVSNEGDNSNVSAPVVQFANSWNLQNAQGFVQSDSEADDIEFEGSSFEFDADVESDSDQSIEQSASVKR